MQHQSRARQMIAERLDDFVLELRRDNGIEIIRSDNTAAEKLQRAWNPSRVLCLPERERQNACQPAILSGREYVQASPAGEMFPPRKQPLVCEEDTPGAADFD